MVRLLRKLALVAAGLMVLVLLGWGLGLLLVLIGIFLLAWPLLRRVWRASEPLPGHRSPNVPMGVSGEYGGFGGESGGRHRSRRRI